MSRVRATYDFDKLPFLLLAERGKIHAAAISGHPVFINPPHTSDELLSVSENLFEAHKDWIDNKGKKERKALLKAADELKSKLRSNANYVTTHADDSRDLIRSAGFTPSKERIRKVKPKCSVKALKRSGYVLFHYRKDDDDKSVVWMHHEGKKPPENIKEYSIAAATVLDNLEFGGFESGTYQCFIAAPVKSVYKGRLVFTNPIVVLIQ